MLAAYESLCRFGAAPTGEVDLLRRMPRLEFGMISDYEVESADLKLNGQADISGLRRLLEGEEPTTWVMRAGFDVKELGLAVAGYGITPSQAPPRLHPICISASVAQWEYVGEDTPTEQQRTAEAAWNRQFLALFRLVCESSNVLYAAFLVEAELPVPIGTPTGRELIGQRVYLSNRLLARRAGLQSEAFELLNECECAQWSTGFFFSERGFTTQPGTARPMSYEDNLRLARLIVGAARGPSELH